MEDLKQTPQASILIVSRNQAVLLRRTLASLQPFADPKQVEVLVVDNASTDGGAQIDSEFPFVSMLRMQRNFGYTKAVNVGTRTAVGEYLCLTPPGIEFTDQTIPALIGAITGESGGLAAAPLVVDADGQPVTRIYRLPDRAMVANFWKTGDLGSSLPLATAAGPIQAEYVVGSPILLRRRSIAAMHYLDERYGQFWSDADLCAQVQRAGRAVVVLPEVVVKGTPALQLIARELDRIGAQISADAALGGAGYLAKYQGFMSGLTFRTGAVISAFFSALAATLTFRQPGAHWTRFGNVATGQKIDGNQGL